MRERKGRGEGKGFDLRAVEELLYIFLCENDPAPSRPNSAMRDLT
jgi:hypothetical protein